MRRDAEMPKEPEVEATAAQEEARGEAEGEVGRRREDRARLPWSWGSRGAGLCFFFLLFTFCEVAFLFLL